MHSPAFSEDVMGSELRRIGLTGGRGVLGRRVGESLQAAGHQVLKFSGDVRDDRAVTDFVERVDLVVHLAAVVPVAVVEANPAAAIDVNVRGSASLASATASKGIRLVHISSSHVYAPSPHPLTETAALAPASQYGLTKLQAEEWIQALHGQQSLILRVFSFFDEAQQEPYLVPTLKRRIQEARTGAVLPVRGAYSVRDLSDAGWMSQLIARLCLSSAVGIVNCGTGLATRILDVAEALAELSGRTDLSFQAPEGDVQTVLIADTTHVTSLLGDLPRFDLREALATVTSE